MADAKGIRAGKAFVELFADDNALARGLKAAQAKLKAFGTGVRNIGLGMSALGSAVVAPMAAAAKSFADSGARLWDMSQRTGLAVEALSLLDYAAEQTGTSLENIEVGIRRMQKSVVGVADAAEGTTGSLDHLGLSAKDLVGTSVLEQFALIAGRIRQIQDPTMKAAAAMKVFGRSGTEILPLIDDFEKLYGQAKGFGLIKSTGSAKQAKEFSQAMTLMGRTISSAWGAIGSAVLPILQAKAEKIAYLATLIRDWIRQNKGLVAVIFQVASVVAIAGAGLAAMGPVISGLGRVFGILGSVISVVGTVLGMLLTPVGMVVAAVTGLGAYLLYTSGAGAKALGWLGERFAGLKEDAMAAYQGIADALAAGDISLAAKVLWLTLKMEWAKGTGWLLGLWYDFKFKLIEYATDGFYGIWAAYEIVAAKLKSAWAGLKMAWRSVMATIQNKANEIAINVALDGKLKEAEENYRSGKISKAGYDLAVRSVNEQRGDSLAKNNADYQAELTAAAAEAAAKGNQIEQEKNAALADIGNRNASARQEFDRQHKQEQDALSADVDKARQEWQEAIGQAKEKRQAKEAGGPGSLESPDDLLAKIKDKLAGAGGALDGAKRTIDVAGTFNAASMLGLQVGKADDRLAQINEGQLKELKNLRADVKNNRAAFG
ncbi:MAG: hypothetical protein LLG01_15980 [Planctomycetaceae bacterium]|nr:hypothetical protein [Planctomycetaceae bacterium]